MMKNNGLRYIRILALMLVIAVVLPCMPALAASYSAAVLDKGGMKVYTDAALKKPYGTLEYRSIVTVLATNEQNVHKIRYQDLVLYCEADEGPTALAEFATPAKVNQKTRVYEEPDAQGRSTVVSKGTSVYILAIDDDKDWAMVERDGNVGYIALIDLNSTSGDPFVEAEPEAPESSEIEGSGEVVIETIEAVVSDSKVTVYKSASSSSEKLGTLKQGAEITVYAYNRDWAYIGLNGNYGFCSLSALRKAEKQDDPFSGASSVPATVTAASVKVYQSASTSSKKLGTLEKGAEVNLIQTSGNWSYIELNGNYGYCDSSALTKTAALLPDEDWNGGEIIEGKSPVGNCTVIVARAGVYSSKSTSKQTGSLSMGSTVNFYAYDSKWVLVGIDGSFAYMQRADLSADSYTELENEDSGTAVLDMEKALLSLGYLDSIPSANYSANTVNALKGLQAACGMENTGVADIGTLRVLYSGNAPASPILISSFSKGDNNSYVQRIQSRLYALGYLSKSSSVDGDFGNNTAAAIRLFQKACGITETGTTDSKTLKALYNANAPELSDESKAADASSSSNTTNIGSDLSSNVSEYVSGMSNAQKIEYVIYIAQQQLGKRYVFGSAGTATFDCSGLTLYCFKQVGVSLKHSAYGEGYNDKWTKISSKSSLRRGDLVFFNTLSDGDLCDHVGIYLGSSKFIHASSGSAKVIISDLSSGYYSRVFSWGRRILNT